jgi:hypothetical protein
MAIPPAIVLDFSSVLCMHVRFHSLRPQSLYCGRARGNRGRMDWLLRGATVDAFAARLSAELNRAERVFRIARDGGEIPDAPARKVGQSLTNVLHPTRVRLIAIRLASSARSIRTAMKLRAAQ